MEENPYKEKAKKELKSMEDFVDYLRSNNKRRPKKLSVNFQHKRFPENTGFAILETTDHYALSRILSSLENQVIQEMKRKEEEINRYGT